MADPHPTGSVVEAHWSHHSSSFRQTVTLSRWHFPLKERLLYKVYKHASAGQFTAHYNPKRASARGWVLLRVAGFVRFFSMATQRGRIDTNLQCEPQSPALRPPQILHLTSIPSESMWTSTQRALITPVSPLEQHRSSACAFPDYTLWLTVKLSPNRQSVWDYEAAAGAHAMIVLSRWGSINWLFSVTMTATARLSAANHCK